MAKKRYSDLDLDFNPHPVSGDVPFKYDAEAVKRSVRNLVFMGIYEKPFHPEIRSEIRRLLFENFTPFLCSKATIEHAASGWCAAVIFWKKST